MNNQSTETVPTGSTLTPMRSNNTGNSPARKHRESQVLGKIMTSEMFKNICNLVGTLKSKIYATSIHHSC